MSPSSVIAFLDRLAEALAAGRFRVTNKADDEIAALGWSRSDALDELLSLTLDDFLRTEPASIPRFGAIWVFCPWLADTETNLWIRLAEPSDHVFIISFHTAEDDPWT